MVWQHKSNGLTLRKQRFGSTKVKVWHCETSTKVIRVGRYEHPRRPIRASASTVTSIRADRYEHPRRSMRMTKVGSMKRKRDGVNEGKEEREAEEREVQAWGKRGASVGKEGCVGMAGMPYPPKIVLYI